MDNKPKRLLFFDILRIASVAAIIFFHIAQVKGWQLFSSLNLIFNIFYLNAGMIGVMVLIFVSGAVLEYSHPDLKTLDDISEFYVKRLFRIYPAFWMSMIIGLVYAPTLTTLYPFSLLLQFIGFNTWSGQWGGMINSVGWFIGLLITLYFFYPFLSASIREYPYQMLYLIAFTEIFFRFALNVMHVPVFGMSPDRYLPICNLLEFSLGIFIVQQNFYPKWTHESRGVSVLAEVSFYVFLIHDIIVIMVGYAPVFYFVSVAVLSWLVMLGDRQIQQVLKKWVFQGS